MRILLLLLFTCASSLLIGQFKISGSIISSDDEYLVGATVVLLDQDSTMMGFCLTNNEGRYIVEDVDSGNYILQATYISYANYSQPIIVHDNMKNDPIILSPSSKVLQEITIKAEHIPMGLKGDTISYNAAAFKTRPNATVEDLLKKLPGIEVDRNGSIKAQGEDVENVLVDGKEFFGSDPKMATKNLSAEAVDKVEVYDKASEIAEFTGVGDGQEEKTINLKLKEDHKKGGFGTAEIAGGSKDSYHSKLNYFRFNPALQTSVIFAANNLNEATFTINDRIDFMGGMMEAMSGGVLNLSQTSNLQDGLNESLSSGVNFNYEFSPKVDFRSHYVLNRTANILEKTNDVTSFSDQFEFGNSDIINSTFRNLNHQVTTKVSYKVNPFLQFSFKNNANWGIASRTRNTSSLYTKDGLDSGFAASHFTSNQGDWAFDSNTLIKKKFKKKGRNLISTITLKRANDLSNDLIDNSNRISGNVFDINQVQKFDNQITQSGFSTNYTEPLSKKYFLSFNYRYGRSKELPSRTYDEFQIDYEKLYVYNVAGLGLKRNTKKLKLSIGLRGQLTSLTGIVNVGSQNIDSNFRHLLPSYTLEYDLKGGHLVSSDFQTAVKAPELEQLIPFPNNTSATYEYLGNPGLRPSYEQRISFNYNYFDNFNFTNFWIQFNITKTDDRIVTKTNIDNNLFRTLQPLNVDDFYAMGGYANFSRPFKPLKIKYKLRLQMKYADYESFINDVKSPIKDNNVNFKVSASNQKTNFVALETGISLDFYSKRYGLAPDFNQNFFNTDYFLESDFFLPKAWVVGTAINYLSYSEESFSENRSFTLISAQLSKFFLDNKLELRLSAFDLLNQNVGFRRLGSANSLREERYNNLSRYFMLGLTYKIGSGKKPGIQVFFDE